MVGEHPDHGGIGRIHLRGRAGQHHVLLDPEVDGAVLRQKRRKSAVASSLSASTPRRSRAPPQSAMGIA